MRWNEENKAPRDNQFATLVQWNGTSEGRRMVERNQKADGEYSMENEKKKKKKMVQIFDKTMTLTDWIFKLYLKVIYK